VLQTQNYNFLVDAMRQKQQVPLLFQLKLPFQPYQELHQFLLMMLLQAREQVYLLQMKRSRARSIYWSGRDPRKSTEFMVIGLTIYRSLTTCQVELESELKSVLKSLINWIRRLNSSLQTEFWSVITGWWWSIHRFICSYLFFLLIVLVFFL